VSVVAQEFILPLGSIIESLQITEADLKSVSGEGRLLRVRGEYLPLGSIIESLQITEADLKSVSGEGRLLRVRGEYLPLIALHDVFSIETTLTDLTQGIVVIIEAEGKKTALLVDELLGQHQVVIKSLESNFRKVPGMSGATIMGDGKVALILDVSALGTHHAAHAR